MLKLHLFKNKKSDIEVSLVHLLEVVLAIGVVMFLIYFSLKLSGIFLGRQEYDSAVNNLNALAKRVHELAADTGSTKTLTTVYGIPDNFILVGFSYDDKGIIKTDCTQEHILESRPKSCLKKSCLCIYQNSGGVTDWAGKDFDVKGVVSPLKCEYFEEKIVFLAPSDPNFRGAPTLWKPAHYSSSSYNYLVLYGICGGFRRTSWGVRQIGIENVKENENIFIIISDLSQTKKISG